MNYYMPLISETHRRYYSQICMSSVYVRKSGLDGGSYSRDVEKSPQEHIKTTDAFMPIIHLAHTNTKKTREYIIKPVLVYTQAHNSNQRHTSCQLHAHGYPQHTHTPPLSSTEKLSDQTEIEREEKQHCPASRHGAAAGEMMRHT